MSAPVKKCEVCDSTGNKSRDIGGDLDCTACSAADERAALRGKLPMTWAEETFAWRAYQLGKAAAGRDDIIVTLRNQYSVLEQALAIESAALGEALRHVANLKERLNAAPVVPVAAQPVVPEGWKLVPEKPTPKMVDATWGDDMAGMSHNKMNKHIYAAMLAAAPSLEAQPAGEVERDAARYRYLRKSSQMHYFAYRNPDMGYAFSQADGKKLDRIIDNAMAQGEKA